MKILSVDQIRKLDEHTIKQEPIASIDLMERASVAFVEWFVQQYDANESITTFCGTGNNGGDGLAISRLLTKRGYQVKVFVIGSVEKGSEDFKINLNRLGFEVGIIEKSPALSGSEVIIDAIFGSGLSRSPEGIYAEVIDAINKSFAKVVAVDTPSGLFADQLADDNIVKANHTVSFQLPKLVFMFPSSYQFVGEWHLADIGLSQKFISDAESSNHFITVEMARESIKPSGKFDHKGSNGHALIIAGAYGTIGAAVLASKAALKAGVGLLTVNTPKCGYNIIQTSLPEAMCIADIHDEYIKESLSFEKYDALGIGPGIGQAKETVEVLTDLLKNSDKPMVLDADALNIISSHQELLEIIPKNAILTPHVKEFERLFGGWKNDFERLELQKAMAKKYNIIIVLKGAHTSIAIPNGEVYFNSTGNPGMAKGGSGDVLCGMITSLLAQGYPANEAAIFGVFMHGLAGDLAREYSHEKSMGANDIVEAITEAYRWVDVNFC